MTPYIEALMSAIRHNYANRKWSSNEFIRDKMIKEFDEGVTFTEGKKYIKIVTGNSVWGFVVNVDNDKKFRKGDILKPAGWATPARNFARGNVVDGKYSVCWTGAS